MPRRFKPSKFKRGESVKPLSSNLKYKIVKVSYNLGNFWYELEGIKPSIYHEKELSK